MIKQKNNLLKLEFIFLFVILLNLCFISAEVYSRSSVAYTPVTSAQYLSKQGVSLYNFDPDKCEAGQDFIVQIAPFGCEPAVVRSDILEEQDFPVFCQLAATKINPLIDVNAIDSLSFTGQYPEEIKTVAFHPANAAIGANQKTILNSPMFNNIGYAVIVLKRQPNESSMPEKVSGNLTVNLKYNLEKAFGIGKVTYYLPQVDDTTWQDTKTSYSFWQGRGYLKAEQIDNSGAVISLYKTDQVKLSTFKLQPGETSNNIYIPGFYCKAALQARLDGMELPQTRAKFIIDGDEVEVIKGEKFLSNSASDIIGASNTGYCTLNSVDKQGIIQKVGINCQGDDGFSSFGLNINPKILLSIDGTTKQYKVGDYLFSYNAKQGGGVLGTSTKYVYLGYIGANGNTNDMKNTYVYFVAIPTQPPNSNTLPQSEIDLIASVANKENIGPVSSSNTLNKGTNVVVKGFAGLQKVSAYLVEGTEPPKKLSFNEGAQMIFDHSIQLTGFAGAIDYPLTGATKTNFDSSISDYKRIISSFGNEKLDTQTETYGERAFQNAIALSISMEQRKTAADLCDEFKQRYPNPNLKMNVCSDAYGASNADISSAEVLINSQTHKITFKGIVEPSFEEFGVQVTVTKKGEAPNPLFIVKNQIVELSSEEIYSVDTSIFSTRLYFKNLDSGWFWSPDMINWMSSSQLIVNGGIYNGKSPTSENQKLIRSLQGQNKKDGLNLLQKQSTYRLEGGNEYIKLLEVNDRDINNPKDDYAVFEVSLRTLSANGLNSAPESAKPNLIIGTSDTFKSEYTFTLDKINIRRLAKITLLPNIQQTGSQANLSFSIGIEKRAIQLSPGQIKKLIKSLDEQIKTWQSISENLGNAVRGFKAACLGVGTALTVKNFFANLGGKSIARSDVMRGSKGWMQSCQEAVSKGTDSVLGKKYLSVNNCLLDNNDKIEKDVDITAAIIIDYNKNPFKKDTIKEEDLQKILNSLNSSDRSKDDLIGAFSLIGLKESKVTLNQIRDLNTWNNVLQNNEASPVLKNVAESKRQSVIGSIEKFTKNFGEQSILSNNLKETSTDFIAFVEVGKNIKSANYGGKTYCSLLGKADANICDDKNRGNIPIQVIQTSEDKFYVAELNSVGGDKLPIKTSNLKDKDGNLLKDEKGNLLKSIYKMNSDGTVDFSSVATDVPKDISTMYFIKRDKTSYQNKIAITDQVVRYFETEPYKGMPAIVPFDVDNGWYASMSQTLPVFGAIRTYDSSGAVSSFYLCNVGKNQRVELPGNGDDICTQFNPGTGEIYGTFSGLEKKDTDAKVQQAISAIKDAQQQYANAVKTGTVRINGKDMKVGPPATNIPDLQCQDFMSPRDCWIMFNACDPVVCPSSRCNLGGAYPVTNVIASGIVGSTFLCLPNYKEKILVPICLSGVKAGTDGLISVFQNYRDCLQTNLDTGQTIGICDEMHSIYLCDFFWKQALPFAKLAIPSLLQVVQGQGSRGGGEYLSVKDSWTNAENSIDYLTQYYGANSYAAFKSRLVSQVETGVCKSFVSASFPASSDFFKALIEPDSPTQFQASFSESVLTTATFPPTSTYKVFYHIFAGKDSGAYYNVYLQAPQGGSYYNTIPYVPVSSGYIPKGEYASQTKDFTAESGYKELCVQVNDNAPECGFRQATTNFAIDELNNLYMKDIATQEGITTEKDCVSGQPNLFALADLNAQQAVENTINPSIYNNGIVRICSTDNPGLSTDPTRWVVKGYCGDQNIRCWLDQNSVKKVITDANLLNQSLKTSKTQLEKIFATGNYYTDSDFNKNLENLKLMPSGTIVVLVTENYIQKSFYNWQKAELLSLRGKAYGGLAFSTYEAPKPGAQSLVTSLPGTSKTIGICKSPAGVSDACTTAGDKFVYIAKGYADRNYNEYRGTTDNPDYGKVCARFVSHVIMDAGVKGIDVPSGEACLWDRNSYLINNLEGYGFTQLSASQYTTGFLAGDLLIFDKKYNKETDHALIFTNYNPSDSSQVCGYSEPGMSGPVKNSCYPLDKWDEAEGVSTYSGWKVYHVFRYNKNDLDLNDCVKVSSVKRCEDCGSGCTEQMCKQINSNCIFTSTATTTPTTVEPSIQALCYYYSQGLTKEGAAYMVGNLIQESGLKPGAVETANTAEGRGLAQWNVNNRWKTFLNWASTNNLEPYNLITQLRYTLEEKDSGSAELNAALRTSDIVRIQNAIQGYERWGILGNRWIYASQVLSNINSGLYPDSSAKCSNLNFVKKADGESCTLKWTSNFPPTALLDNTGPSDECLSGWCVDVSSFGGQCGAMRCGDCGDENSVWNFGFGNFCDTQECNSISQQLQRLGKKGCTYDSTLGVGSCKEIPAPPAGQINNVALIGDSLTIGYAQDLKAKLGNKFVDGSGKSYVSGKDTSWMLNNALPFILNSNPKPNVVVVLGGTNDLANSVNVETIESNLQNIYTQLNQNNIKVIALTLPKFGDNYNNAAIANQNIPIINSWINSKCDNINIFCVDIYDATSQLVLPNDVHLTLNGYQRIANMVSEKLSEMSVN